MTYDYRSRDMRHRWGRKNSVVRIMARATIPAALIGSLALAVIEVLPLLRDTSDPVIEAEVEADASPETDIDTDTEASPEQTAEAEAEASPETDVDVDVEASPETVDVDVEASPETGVNVDVEASPEIKVDVAVTVNIPDTPEPEAEASTESEPESEPEPEPAEPAEPPEPPEPAVFDDYKEAVNEDDCWTPGSDQWCFFAGHATSYVAWRINTVRFRGVNWFTSRYGLESGSWGDAENWATAAEQADVNVSDAAAVGSIAHWEAGFVAYVEDVIDDDAGSVASIVISDMNSDRNAELNEPGTWTLRAAVVCTPPPEEQCDPFGWPDNFIHIPDAPTGVSCSSSAEGEVFDFPEWIPDKEVTERNEGWRGGDPVGGFGAPQYFGGSRYAFASAVGGWDQTNSEATWHLGQRAGEYEIEAYVPRTHSTATVTYHIHRDDERLHSKTVNQLTEKGWVMLAPRIDFGDDLVEVTVKVHYEDSQPAGNIPGPEGQSIAIDAIRIKCV